ncbi:MAG: 30S ribosomal protein S9 [Marinilabiliales bacterium]|nr:MAG: 30S ribosomal protein S9 [Marinilabiliales bacterium]
MEAIKSIGRRKSAIARLHLTEGKGNITINKKDLSTYFPLERHQNIVLSPLRVAEMEDRFDIKINLDGGGISGQAQALRMAIARAVIKVDPEKRSALKTEGFLTRDAREVERKKPGRPKARKKFQFSKR